MLGFDHAEVGSKLLEGWELPKRLVEIVAYHHKPLESENFSMDACIVHMADALIYEMGIGNSGEHAFKGVDPNVVKMVNLPADALPVIKEEVASMVDETVRMFM
jgi:HD-like signal output (HDOD) protein